MVRKLKSHSGPKPALGAVRVSPIAIALVALMVLVVAGGGTWAYRNSQVKQAATLKKQAMDAVKNRDMATADSSIKASIKKNGKDPEAYFWLGIIRFNQDDKKGAIDAYSKATDLKPDYAEAWNNLANVQRNNGDLDKAIASYQKALSIDSKLGQTYINLAVVYEMKENWAKALETVLTGTKQVTNRADMWVLQGDIQDHQGQNDAAIASYQQALKIDATNPDAKAALDRLAKKR